MKIYLDNCCFNRPFDNQLHIRIKIETEAKLFIQQEIVCKRLELVWSYILDYENEKNPFVERKESIRSWKKYATIDVEETKDVLEKAYKIVKTGIKSKDALHIACAIVSSCDFFLTTDDFILKKSEKRQEIRVIDPTRFIREVYQC